MLYIDAIIKIADRINVQQTKQIRKTAEACAASIEKARAVLLFGAGHSALPCQEAFPRIGSIVGFVQITEPNLGFNGFVTGKGGQKQMSFLEQTEGYGEVIFSNYRATEEDTLIVFSNSGINALPLELCLQAQERGLTTVGVSSHAHSKTNKTKTSRTKKRLFELVDIAIDNCTPEGDAIIENGTSDRLGGSSTIANMLIMNSIVVETAHILQTTHKQVMIYPSHNVTRDIESVLAREESIFTAHKNLIAKL